MVVCSLWKRIGCSKELNTWIQNNLKRTEKHVSNNVTWHPNLNWIMDLWNETKCCEVEGPTEHVKKTLFKGHRANECKTTRHQIASKGENEKVYDKCHISPNTSEGCLSINNQVHVTLKEVGKKSRIWDDREHPKGKRCSNVVLLWKVGRTGFKHWEHTCKT